jgi:hypothetical protein
MTREVKWGLNWKEGMKCSSCKYVSPVHKLYKEISGDSVTGRKSSTCNVGLQIGLSKTPIGNNTLRSILLAADIPAPSTSGLQKAANRVNAQLIKENKADMQQRRQTIIEVNTARGLPANSLSISGDGAFNNPLSSASGQTPWQPATQVTYVVTENVTKDKQVLSLATRNKLCSKHHRVKNESCVLNAECSATLKFSSPIGNEKELAKECVRELNSDNLAVTSLTTDADSAAYQAVKELHREGELETCPESFLDTRHLSASQRRLIRGYKFVSDMMCSRTKSRRDKLASKFSVDCAARCNAEFNSAFRNHTGNVTSMKKALSQASDAIAHCYVNDHSKCGRKSFICKGGKSNWLNSTSSILSNCRDFKIEHTESNIQNLKKCIDLRLGPRAVEKTYLNLNTQKTEAVNKSLKNSLPRNRTFSRNFPGRAHSAIHSVNLKSSAKSVALLRNRLGCPVTRGSLVARQLQQINNQTQLSKEQKQTPKCKLSRIKKKVELFKLHDESRNDEITYSKDMISPHRKPKNRN